MLWAATFVLTHRHWHVINNNNNTSLDSNGGSEPVHTFISCGLRNHILPYFLADVHMQLGPRPCVCGLPVFCGPTTMNLGSLSQVFSLDQISLCRLSSHGFWKMIQLFLVDILSSHQCSKNQCQLTLKTAKQLKCFKNKNSKTLTL